MRVQSLMCSAANDKCPSRACLGLGSKTLRFPPETNRSGPAAGLGATNSQDPDDPFPIHQLQIVPGRDSRSIQPSPRLPVSRPPACYIGCDKGPFGQSGRHLRPAASSPSLTYLDGLAGRLFTIYVIVYVRKSSTYRHSQQPAA